jgi:hypothetical protein
MNGIKRGCERRRLQPRETILMQKMRRRLNCSVPSTYRELKNCTVRGWNREVVHMSVRMGRSTFLQYVTSTMADDSSVDGSNLARLQG